MIHEETDSESMEQWQPSYEASRSLRNGSYSRWSIAMILSIKILASVTRGPATCMRYVRVFEAQFDQ